MVNSKMFTTTPAQKHTENTRNTLAVSTAGAHCRDQSSDTSQSSMMKAASITTQHFGQNSAATPIKIQGLYWALRFCVRDWSPGFSACMVGS